MRRSLLAAALVLMLHTWPAPAQVLEPATGGEQAPEPPPTVELAPASGRVLMDLTFWTLPGPVPETCVELPAGRLTVTVLLQGERTRPPATYVFAPARQREPDQDAEIRTPVTSEPTTAAVPLSGGRYCYAILNHTDVPVRGSLASPEPVGQAQAVAVTMVLTPR